MKKVVLKLDLHDDKGKEKAMEKVSRLNGVVSISMDMKDKKLTVTGDIDPVVVVAKLRKLCHTEIVTVGPAKEPEKKKEEPKKEEPKKEGGDDKKKDEAVKLPQIAYPNYYQQYPHFHHPTPYMQHQNYYRSAEEDPNSPPQITKTQENMKKVVLKLDFHDDKGLLKAMKTVFGLNDFLKPEEHNLYTPDQKSSGEEDSEYLQLQVHQYSDPPIGVFGRGSTSGNAPEEGVLSMGELINEMEEVEDEESLNEVTRSFYEELLEVILSGELKETPSDRRELEKSNCHPLEVPPTISHHFSILSILDLSSTEINFLPQSISRLVALQKLFLRSCELLMELPPEIGELTNLEVLDLEGTKILCLPKEIAKLVKLTCLKVSFYEYANQTIIPRRVLSNLSSLIELIIDVTPYGGWWDVEVEAIIDDLCTLKELRTLKLYLPTAELLEDLTLIFPGLENFRFTIGRHKEHFISRLPHDVVEEEFNNWEKLKKGLKYINGSRIPNEITKVFKHANGFFLQRHWTAKSLSEFGHENMNEVKFCLVMECNEFQTIIDSEQFYGGKDGRDSQDFDEAIVLGSLEKLIICYMKNMESIWRGPVGKGSLSNLKSLALHTCFNLTTLFTVDMLINLTNLEELIVEDCPKIESLVSVKSSNSESGLFLPSLKKISLLELPELVSISSSLCIAPKLVRMVIFYCPKLKKLSAMEVSSTDMKVIKGEKEWWDALEWYESDLGTKQEDYLAGLFIPLRRDGDLMAQLTKDEIGAYGQDKVGSYKRQGVDSIALDMKGKKLTVIGDIDPVTVLAKLRKLCHTEILTVEEPERYSLRNRRRRSSARKQEMRVKLKQIAYPYPTHYQTHYTVSEKDPNSRVIC